MNARTQVREHIMNRVAARPGSTFTELRKSLASSNQPVSRPALLRHLNALEAAGTLVAAKSGRSRHYYPSRGPWMEALDVCAFLQSAGRWPIAVALAFAPSLTVPKIREHIGADTTAWQVRLLLRSLTANGLVVKSQRGRSVSYEATARMRRIVEYLVAATEPRG